MSTNTQTDPDAARCVRRLTRNVDAWYADRITFDEFGRRQRRTWDVIAQCGPAFVERVDAILRARPRTGEGR